MEKTTIPQREIKFRAWATKAGKMVDLKAITPLAVETGILDENDGLFIPFRKDIILMQFAGLQDKNGRYIYEGDVYFEETEHNEGDDRVYYVILWIKEWAMFSLLTNGERIGYEDNGIEYLDDSMRYTFMMDAKELSMMHFAGNIFEKPELLEK